MYLQFLILLLMILIKCNQGEWIVCLGNGEEALSKLLIEIWMFYLQIQYVTHMHWKPAGIIVVI